LGSVGCVKPWGCLHFKLGKCYTMEVLINVPAKKADNHSHRPKTWSVKMQES
jgi:hypothetical protein